MTFYQQDEKDISKVFCFLRAQLHAKEKELLQLQRKDPSLTAPDSQQIDMLVDAIASLQISTEDGSFVFASASDDEDHSSSYASVCSADFNTIKALPLTAWLSEERSKQQANRRQSSSLDHLLSLPIQAYLASSWPATFDTTSKTRSSRSFQHLSMKSHLLFMPLNTFKPSPHNHFNTNRLSEKNVSRQTKRVTSFLNHDISFSKDFWLKNHGHGASNRHFISCA